MWRQARKYSENYRMVLWMDDMKVFPEIVKSTNHMKRLINRTTLKSNLRITVNTVENICMCIYIYTHINNRN